MINLKFKLEDSHKSIFLFSYFIFIVELLLFKILLYASTYLNAVQIIGHVLIGIAFGGIAASRYQMPEKKLFLYCIMGSAISLLLALFKITSWLSYGLENISLSVVFFFPSYYISSAFLTNSEFKAYSADMFGAGFAVLSFPFLYHFMNTEQIIFFILAVFSAFGIIRGGIRFQFKKAYNANLLLCLLCSSIFLYMTFYDDKGHFNLFHWCKKVEGLSHKKHFEADIKLKRTYDNLVARTDVWTQDTRRSMHKVSYEGYPNDHFNEKGPSFFKRDIRVVNAFIKNPKIFLIGPSAQGVVKTAINMTPQSNITAFEINPAPIKMMTRDFLEESAGGYQNININEGNGLAYLKTTKNVYDVITLINAHSTPSLSEIGQPDYSHTKEAYKIYLEKLSARGYLMFEERPMNKRGRYSVLKQISTLHAALRELGYKNPNSHFFIYGWTPKKEKFIHGNKNTYIGIYVGKNPISLERRNKILTWWQSLRRNRVFSSITPHEVVKHDKITNLNILFLQNFIEKRKYSKFMAALENDSLDNAYPMYNLQATTKNSPFSTQVYKEYSEIYSLVKTAGLITFFIACLIFYLSTRISYAKSNNILLLLYQGVVGIAYLLAEIGFIQFYQDQFISPTLAVMCTLGILLIGSALGCLILRNTVSIKSVIGFLVLIFFLHGLFLFHLSDHVYVHMYNIFIIVALILLAGIAMGYFYPQGIRLAKLHKLEKNIGYYFAFNSIAGAFATPLALVISIHSGYSTLLLVSAVLYVSVIPITYYLQRSN